MTSAIYFPPAPTPPPPDPAPSQIGEGWPRRAGREHYGKDMVDEAPLANPETSLDADTLNLAFWQVGALGLLAPLAVIAFEPSEFSHTTDVVKFGAWTWVDQVLTNQPASAATGCTITRLSTSVDFAFPATAVGSDGQPHPIVILGAEAKPIGYGEANTSRHHARVTITGQTVNVHVFDTAGADLNSSFVLVVY